MRSPFAQIDPLKHLLAAAMLVIGLAGCGGGGGGVVDSAATTAGAAPDTNTAVTSPVTATTTASTTPSNTVAGTTTVTTTTPAPAQSVFYASWTAALVDSTAVLPGATAPAPETFANQTIRQVVRLSLGGGTLRLKVSNLFGKTAITISAVRVARSTGGSAIDVASDRAVTFGGQGSVSLAAGAEALSDPVALPVNALSHLAVSMYFAGPTPMPTIHTGARQTAYLAIGNQLAAPSIDAGGADRRDSYYGLAAVETSSAESTKVVVAFGDSITNGTGSSMDADRRYPNLLDDRVKAAGSTRTGVVNAGIPGNRWLHDFAGPSGNNRFDRDVLGVAGATHTIILMGINDIGFAVSPAPAQEVSAQQIIDAIATAAARAKAAGLKPLLGTLLPFKGAGYFSAAGEENRQTVNAWIRGNPDAPVVDFDLAMRSADDAATLNPAYDSGDHLHPNDAGYAAMANAVDLAKLQ